MNAQDMQVGDEIWVVNSRETAAFEATVTDVSATLVGVVVPEKDPEKVLYFDRETGYARNSNGPSRSYITTDDDWRVQVILDWKDNAFYQERIIATAGATRKSPSVEKIGELEALVAEWREFILMADPAALVSSSIPEYIQAKELNK